MSVPRHAPTRVPPRPVMWLLATALVLGTACFERDEPADQNTLQTPAEIGLRVFQRSRCNACHTLDGRALSGPTLKGIYGKPVVLADGSTITRDDSYLRRSILEPKKELVRGYPPAMLDYRGQLDREDVEALIAMIRSLTPGADSARAAR